MAEKWLEEIYHNASIIQELHEVISCLYSGDLRQARAIYNNTASHLESLIADVAKTDTELATHIQDCAVEVMDAWEDPHLASGKIESVLLPCIFDYMSNFTDISVEDNGWLLESSDSGFLTVKDLTTGLFLHDTHDPLFEAFRLSEHIYKPEMEVFRIFGSGLGYLPYILWKRSDRSMHIFIYEEDQNILQYAQHFGLLSWIDEDFLDIVTDSSPEKLAKRFLDDVRNDNGRGGRYVSPNKGVAYSHIYEGLISRLSLTDNSNRVLRRISTINLWNNNKLRHLEINDLKKRFSTPEWIVIAAGPSFDESLDFIRENMENCNIVAVNTVLKRLQSESISPHLSVAADPYEQICDHILGIQAFTSDIPLIADKLTYWRYSREYSGEKCFVATEACRFIPDAISQNEPVWQVGGTVSSMAIEAAIRLGAETIHLIGLDLAYPDGVNYAKGMPHERRTDSHVTMTVSSTDGNSVGTNEVFDLFRKTIEEHQISPHKNIRFINHSLHGARIAGTIPYHKK